MPKPQYSQKFRDSWLQDPDFKEWLQAVESTTGQVAKCKFCGTILRSHYGDLKTHALLKKHQQNRKVITKQPKLTFKMESTDNKKKDKARVALFTAMHTKLFSVSSALYCNPDVCQSVHSCLLRSPSDSSCTYDYE
ncbi:unnamed protein product [Parnassius apollo]|uniref:(apollo) hypothetical protein n=1 Tax=Parnassius apollo TaxID=110799 RepID=A0A8S3XQV7_PARAO|nr:unnamed protein product [Parnassius apollo]